MQLFRTLPHHADSPTAIAIGNFDGLHCGHQAVIAAMQHAAAMDGLVPSVMTFTPHPRRFFQPSSPNFALEPIAQRLARLAALGVLRVYMPRFNAAFAAMPAEAFLHGILQRSMGARAVVVGDDFVFGHARRGNAAMLRAWGTANGVAIHTIPPVTVCGEACSSSTVRGAIDAGDMPRAERLLGRTYRLQGRVMHGEKRGRMLGFPTANVALPPGILLPVCGVYAVMATHGNRVYAGVANLGLRPTVGAQSRPSLEVHLFDTDVMLYGTRLSVHFHQYLRGEQRFEGLEALTAQIAADCVQARAVLENIQHAGNANDEQPRADQV